MDQSRMLNSKALRLAKECIQLVKRELGKMEVKFTLLGPAFIDTLSPTILLLAAISLPNLAYSSDVELRDLALKYFSPLPAFAPQAEQDTIARQLLGEKLFMDERLSVNSSQSCNSCHNITDRQGAGVDNEITSVGALGKPGRRNSPTVWNSSLQFAQFWDGRAKDLADQAKHPILAPLEMALPNEQALVRVVEGIPEYRPLFTAAFGLRQPISVENIAEALAAFQRTLISHDRFDEFLRGDNTALNDSEKMGLVKFISLGCVRCHNGPTIGGNSFQKLGVVNAYANQEDLGRFEVTGNTEDRLLVKVPMLRNVALTPPYFHNGRVHTLFGAIQQMAWLQLGVELGKFDTEVIATFLGSLNNTRPFESLVHKLPE